MTRHQILGNIKYMKKLFMAVLLALGLCFGANASDLFTGNELSLSLGSGYAVNTAAAFQQPYSKNVDAGVQYYFNKYIGVDLDVPFYSTKGTSVSDAKAGLLFRVPVLTHFAVYAGLGGDYNWTGDTFKNVQVSKFSYLAKAGLEFRPVRHLGVFVEDVYQNNQLNALVGGQQVVHGGLRFVF